MAVDLVLQMNEFLKLLRNRLITAEELAAVQTEHGYEFATGLLYRSILNTQPHAGFFNHIHSVQPMPDRRSLREEAIEVVFVPSVSLKTWQRWGDHVDWMRVEARNLGFSTDVIETREGESISGNARRISDYLQNATAKRIILISFGRGSAEVRTALQRRGPRAPELRKLRGWLSLCGSLSGHRLMDLRLSDPWERSEIEIRAWFKRHKRASFLELSAQAPFWRQRLFTHDQLMIVSVVGLLQAEQVSLLNRKNFNRLMALGPNDGANLAFEAMARPGTIFPVMGLSQNLERPVIEPILKRLLTVMGASIRRTDRSLEQSALSKPPADITIS